MTANRTIAISPTGTISQFLNFKVTAAGLVTFSPRRAGPAVLRLRVRDTGTEWPLVRPGRSDCRGRPARAW